MPTIQATVENKVITLDDTCVVCNNSDYTMQFTLDEQFSSLNNLKCRFICNGEYQDVNVQDGSCDVPAFEKTTEVKVGVYGNGRQGIRVATTYAVMKCRHSIMCETPDET